jgi:hypothetical protein
MQQNLDQHQQFLQGVSELETYFKQIKQTPEAYNPENVRSMIEKFGPVFVQHLTEEIPSIAPEILESIFPDKKDLLKIRLDGRNWVLAHIDKKKILPWVLSSAIFLKPLEGVGLGTMLIKFM